MSHKTKLLLRSSILALSMLLGSGNLAGFAASSQPKVDLNNNYRSSVNPSSVKVAGITRVQDNLVFDLLGCRRNQAQIDCIFKITYIGNGNLYGFNITTARVFSAIDGNQYDAFGTSVAGRFSVDMISGQPVKGIVSFPFYPNLKRVGVFEVGTSHTNSNIVYRFKNSR